MTPEELARQDIDRQLAQCGWQVQSRNEMNILAALGVAVREFAMQTGEADYLLYAGGKAIGVIEAKPRGHPLVGVEGQSAKYAGALPPGVPAHGLPLPFSYESTGAVTQFTNLLEPDARSREVFTFHRPEELLRLVHLDAQVRAKLKALPAPDAANLWSVQIGAIENLRAVPCQERPAVADPDGDRIGKDFHRRQWLLPADQVRRGEATFCHGTWTIGPAILASRRLKKVRIPMASVAVFPDTNIFLHCLPIHEIKWEEIFAGRTVKLVVCLQVIDELDRHKRDSRLKERAAAALKQIERLAARDAIARGRVALEIFRCNPRNTSGSSVLLQPSQDAQLLDQVLDYRRENPEEEVVVVSQDYGMRLRCTPLGINSQLLDAMWERPVVEDPSTKELKKAELDWLKKRTPDLHLIMMPEGSYAFPVECLKLAIPGDRRHLDVEQELRRLQDLAPLDLLQDRTRIYFDDPSLEGGTRLSPDADSVSERWNEYVLAYSSFLVEQNDWAELRLRCLQFDLWLSNQGGSRANKVLIELAFRREILEWADALDGEYGRRLASRLRLLRAPRRGRRPCRAGSATGFAAFLALVGIHRKCECGDCPDRGYASRRFLVAAGRRPDGRAGQWTMPCKAPGFRRTF